MVSVMMLAPNRSHDEAAFWCMQNGWNPPMCFCCDLHFQAYTRDGSVGGSLPFEQGRVRIVSWSLLCSWLGWDQAASKTLFDESVSGGQRASPVSDTVSI
eukprot:CAMPEP_0174344354 /NCGR_PEP_ID=MMETSP0810-20121108/27610_1 /TAXON_ID=73025 ORGANISM="Eutreptiella gymnastica-like, Strain CCMP1594" /NCGR_SAMPLE_ID=MMETSP0810 /ASSEMBLY_ACC=CAM_ASM_000659 /LENGTH=99 /DNA_ID=CAMNT_0015467471 /DNA_START=548 /DNA_END=847 /DNA_ORIENTATION=-